MTAVRVVRVDGSRANCAGISASGGGSKVLVAELVPHELLAASHSSESLETPLAENIFAQLSLDALAKVVATGAESAKSKVIETQLSLQYMVEKRLFVAHHFVIPHNGQRGRIGRLCGLLDDVVAAVDIVSAHDTVVDTLRAVLRLLTFGVGEVHRTAEGDSRNMSVVYGLYW